MKTRQQRRSTVGFVLWTGVALCWVLVLINLTDPDATPVDRLVALAAMAGATLLSYGAGRWREL